MSGGHGPGDDDTRFAGAVAAIDAANAEDPNRLVVEGTPRPKELVHAELVTGWVRRLRPDASEELLLAARGHHFRRWTVPRASYPSGRAGYLKWRRDLHDRHARELGELLAEHGYSPPVVARVGAIVRKERLRHDDEVQTLEDALCLTFLQTQLGDVAARLDDEDKMASILAKTAAKMSAAGLAAAAELDLDDTGRALLRRALEEQSS